METQFLKAVWKADMEQILVRSQNPKMVCIGRGLKDYRVPTPLPQAETLSILFFLLWVLLLSSEKSLPGYGCCKLLRR